MTNELAGFWSSSTAVATIAFVGQTTQTADDSDYTFTNHAIGVASYDRVVLVGIYSYSSGGTTLESVTIGGITATIISFEDNDCATAIVAAHVPAGTTATIVVDYGFFGTVDRCSIAVHTLTGTNGIVTAFSTASDSFAAANTLSASLAVPANGAVFATTGFADSISTGSVSWVGATETFDSSIETALNRHATATASNQPASASLNVQATISLDHDLGEVMLVATFKPFV